MARFRLRAKHYLNTDPPALYEHKETNRETGKQAIRHYPVPQYLDPDYPGDQNYPGEIIVATKASREYPRDIVFIGPPTPDMEPLDEEAEAMIAALSDQWIHPIEGLPTQMDEMSYADRRARDFERELGQAREASSKEVSDLRKQLEDLQRQLSALTNTLSQPQERRRV